MTRPAAADVADAHVLPITKRGRLPEAGLRRYRSIGGWRIQSRWTVNVRGAFRVPDDGPVIFASNHIGWLDGPLLIALSPRPAHALVKAEAFTGLNRWLLKFAGQIKTRRKATSVGAMRTAVRALRANQCVMIWPEGTRGAGELERVHPGVGYLASVSGAPVIPVAVFGTRQPGDTRDARPPKGATIEIMYGDPIRVARCDWPRTQDAVSRATTQIAGQLRDHLEQAQLNSHIGLPGPLGNNDV